MRNSKPQSIVELLEGKLFSTAMKFEDSIRYLDSKGYEVASSEQVLRAGLELYTEKERVIPNGFVKEACVWMPSRGVSYITKNNPIIQDPESYIQFREKEPSTIYKLPKEQIEKSLKGAQALEGSVTEITGGSEIAEYLFGDGFAGSYENFALRWGEKNFEFGTAYFPPYPMASPIEFDFYRGSMGANCCDSSNVVFAVPKGSEQNLGLGSGKYSFFIDLINKVRKGEFPNSRLEEATEFLKKQIQEKIK